MHIMWNRVLAGPETPNKGYAIVLDYWNKPSLNAILVHAISECNFMLLELLGKPEVNFSRLERINIDPKYDEKIKSIGKRLYFENLSINAKQNLEAAIKYIILEKNTEIELIKHTRSFFLSCTSKMGIEVKSQRLDRFMISTILKL